MSHFKDAIQLVDHAKNAIKQIEYEYKISIHEKEIKPTLLIEIKNIMENLRSALDFSAHGLYDKYGNTGRLNPKIYFPYALSHQNLPNFRSRNIIEDKIPGLSTSRPDIVNKIESYQHFSDPKNTWLPMFMELNNENKHQKLTPQTRKEVKELRISSGGSTLSLGEGSFVSIGKGSHIQIGGIIIPGGQKITTESPPVTVGKGKTEIITWVSFIFTTNNELVLPFINKCLAGIEIIVNELSVL